MLDGRYDFSFPTETAQRPMFNTFGTPKSDKRFVLLDSGHILPRNAVVKETLNWLDRYLGPVK